MKQTSSLLKNLSAILCLFQFILFQGIVKGQGVPQFSHIVVVIGENTASGSVYGNANAPYINALAAAGAKFTNSLAITHPSQPNYIDLYSGNNQGVVNDNLVTVKFTTANLGAELIQAGKTYTTFSDGLPSVGFDGATSGKYARKHNPAANWMGSGVNQIPVTTNQPFTAFPANFNTLPSVSFVVPDLCHDGHDVCAPISNSVKQYDTWIQQNLDAYKQWCINNNSLLIVTYDEDDNTVVNKIATVFYGAHVATGSYAQTINHYSVLRTMEDAFSLPSHAGAASTATPIDYVWIIPALTATAANNGSACSGTTINLSVTAAGGISPYTYTWTGPNGFTSTVQNPPITNVGSVNGGTYTVVVKDAQSPQASVTVTTAVVVKNTPTASITPVGPTTVCSNNTPIVLTAVTNAVAPIYEWRKRGVAILPEQTGSKLFVTGSGSYTVLVTDNGCARLSAGSVVTVKQSTGSTLDTAVCGSSFTWNGTTYFASGIYTKTFTNAVGCDSIATLQLRFSKIISKFTKSDSICFVATTGFVSVTALGGIPPYSYKLGTTGTYQSSGLFTGLKAGNYRVYIMDSIGCTTFTSYMLISQYPKITSTFTKTDASCYGSATGSITVNAANGFPPYTFRLGTTGAFGSANTFNNLVGGSYRVYIMDAKNCQMPTATIVVGQPIAVSATYSTISAACYGTATASLTVSGTNGVAPYKYRLGTAGVFSMTNTFSNIKGATYKVYIQDAHGCIGSIAAVVPQPAAITLSFSKVDIGCTSPGSITVIKTGGPSNPPYQYKLNTTAYGTNSTFSVSTAGNYYGYIKDSLGCLARTSVIAMPAPTGCRNVAKTIVGDENKASSLKVSLSPNPSTDNFTLIAHSKSAKLLYIRVLNAEGRNVYSAKGVADQSFIFGEKLSNGIYTIEVRQGDEVKIMKAVKGK